MDKQSKKINLGCGGHYYADYINVDMDPKQRTDLLTNVNNLSGLGELKFEFVLASHILEHFPFSETIAVLKEWHRIMEDGGLIEIRVPDLYILTRDYVAGKIPVDDYFRPRDEQEHPRNTEHIDAAAPLYLAGKMGADEFSNITFRRKIKGDRHDLGFDAISLVNKMKAAGFVDIAVMPKTRPMQPDPADRPRIFENCLVVQARKPARRKLKLALCMHELWAAPFDGYCSISKIMNAIIPFLIRAEIEIHILSKQGPYSEYSMIGGVHYHRHKFETVDKYRVWVGTKCDELGIDIVEVYNRAWLIPTKAKRLIHMDNDHFRQDHLSTIEACSKVTLISDYVYERTMEKIPSCKEKYMVNKLGVNLGIYHPGQKEPVPTLLWLGLIGRHKGFHVFKNIADKLLESIPDLQVWVIGPVDMKGTGSGKHYEALQNQNKRYEFLGFLDEAEVADRLRRAWLMLAPMIFPYTWSLAIMEALASGTPAVVTPIGGLPEIIIEGETGWLCNNQEDIFQKTLAVMTNLDLSESIGACARKYAEKYSWKMFAERAITLYREIANV